MPDRDRALSALCDTFIPGSDQLPSASALGTPQRLRAELEALGRPELVAELDRLLDTLQSPILNLILSGRPAAFTSLPATQREALLMRWAESPFALKRRAFQVMNRLSMLYTYGAPDSPYWSVLDYQRPALPAAAESPRLTVRTPRAGETVDADVCVIGTGAGGSVVAAELAARGKQVVMLERAQLSTEESFQGLELAGSAALYLDRGIASTRDHAISLLAGSAVGGGTVVNWSTSLRLPDAIAQEWARLGVDGLESHYGCVEARLDVDAHESQRNGANAVLERGMQALGLAYRTIPRNVRGCGDCGHCGYGCRTGAKQSTLRTYLVDACERGAEILAGCEARRIQLSGGRADCVVARVRDGEVAVRASQVVLAGGSLLSPALLLRSGIGGPQVGKRLCLHPVAVVTGEYESPIRHWSGVPQSVVSEAFDDELRPGYGFRIECPPALPGILAASVPWWGSARHLGEMSRAPRTAAFILIARDAGGGEVRVNRQGEPVVSYGLSSEIQDLLTRAMTQGARIHWAAGATRVATLHTPPLAFDSGEGNAEAIRRRGVSPNRVSLFSAHQMASCRIGVDRESSVANPEGQVWDIPNLHIADASAFPVSSGVNPMLTVMALARRTAQRMP